MVVREPCRIGNELTRFETIRLAQSGDARHQLPPNPETPPGGCGCTTGGSVFATCSGGSSSSLSSSSGTSGTSGSTVSSWTGSAGRPSSSLVLVVAALSAICFLLATKATSASELPGSLRQPERRVIRSLDVGADPDLSVVLERRVPLVPPMAAHDEAHAQLASGRLHLLVALASP